MKRQSIWNFVPPPGPVLTLLLIGLVLLSGLLHYRAVKIQRFLEPALALSQPRNEFSEAIASNVQKEFAIGPFRGLEVRTSSIVIDKSLLFVGENTLHASGRVVLKKLGRVLLALMEDKHWRSDISLVLITGGYAPGPAGADSEARLKAQQTLGIVQDALFHVEPALGSTYRSYFAVVARPGPPGEQPSERLEIRIIPSEVLHMEVLQRLQKYTE
jgi:hypothetical protein